MKLRPRLLLALLLYVTLDLSLPAMPGAFVFDAADSVETVHANRDAGTGEAVLLPAPSNDSVPAPCPVRIDARVAPARRPATPARATLARRPAAAADAPRSSEDPH